MIQSFKDTETEKVWQRQFSKKLPPEIQTRAYRKLTLLDIAGNLNDLKIPPANQLEELKRERLGQHSIRINQQWRICFQWKDNQAFEVEITDYH